MNYTKRFMVEPGTQVKLHKIDPGYIDPDVTEKDALAETKRLCKKLRKLQAALYSEKQRSVLIVLQALDTGGKDGVIPSDCKWFRNLAVARIVVDCLEGLKIRPP